MSSLALLSCRQIQNQDEEPVSDFALAFVADRQSEANVILRSTAIKSHNGSIFVIGEYDRTSKLKDFLIADDRRDNISAAVYSDGIPDFGGEEFVVLYDFFASPYSDFFEQGTLDSLRVLTTRNCIEAVNSKCGVSPYDLEGLGSKNPAKIIVLNSAYQTAFGQHDAKFVFNALGSSVSIISPMEVMLENLFSESKDSYRIAVFASPEVDNPEVYTSLFRKECVKRDKAPSECFVFHNPSQGDPLINLLDAYKAAGKVSQLDAILVDDIRLDAESLASTYKTVNSVMDEKSVIYGSLLKKDFSFLVGKNLISDKCYDILRTENNFRLMITRPYATELMSTDRLMIPYSDKYIR